RWPVLAVAGLTLVIAAGFNCYDSVHTRMQVRAIRAGVRVLAEACERYKAETGEYPAKLEDLAKPRADGGAPLVPAETLKDPWGEPWRYDRQGRYPAGKRPDIWTHLPGTPAVVGNWLGGPYDSVQ